MFLKPPRVHRSSNSKYNDLKRVMSADSATFDKGGMEYSGEVEGICSKTERVLSPEKPGDEQKSKFLIQKSELNNLWGFFLLKQTPNLMHINVTGF